MTENYIKKIAILFGFRNGFSTARWKLNIAAHSNLPFQIPRACYHSNSGGFRGNWNQRHLGPPTELRMRPTHDRDLTIPPVPEEVWALQERVSARAALVESGEEPQPAFLGLISREPKKLNPQERFVYLEDLLVNCRQLHTLLSDHRKVLISYFSKLTSRLSWLVSAKIAQMKELEGKRRKLSEIAGRPITTSDEANAYLAQNPQVMEDLGKSNKT